MTKSRIAVLESRWWEGYNSSIREQFDLICDMYYGTHHAYEYEMVGTVEALAEAAVRLSRSHRADVLYIGTHGSTKNLFLHGQRKSGGGEQVSGKDLAEMLCRANHRRKTGINGLYVKACDFGTKTLAENLLNGVPRLTWVAGYRAKVDIVESSALDMLFFNDWLRRRGEPQAKIERVAAYMRQNLLNLCDKDDIRFSIYARDAKGEVSDILRREG